MADPKVLILMIDPIYSPIGQKRLIEKSGDWFHCRLCGYRAWTSKEGAEQCAKVCQLGPAKCAAQAWLDGRT